MRFNRQRLFVLLLFIAAVAGYWLLPISGDVIVLLDDNTTPPPWPRLRFEPDPPRPGETAVAILADITPWVYVQLWVNGEREAQFLQYTATPLGYGEWSWSFTVPETNSYQLTFYHDCDQGCVTWAERTVNNVVNAYRFPVTRVPTKLGVVFPHPDRDWHNRSGWVVELTYAQRTTEQYWGLDDLAKRVETAVTAGHRVLVRVDYDQGQSIPPDEAALENYLAYLRRLARDDRLNGVYGYIIGSSYNASDNSVQGVVTPEWYARVFNGHGTDVAAMNHVIAVIRAENPTVRVLVGPVQPWTVEQDGERPFTISAPWLNYFYTLLTALDESAQARADIGLPLMWPDGFTVQAFGRLDSLNLDERPQEPQISLYLDEWPKAQAGFRVYQDWLAVINTFSTMRGLPVYITATNTHQPDSSISPAQNYPTGWLTMALAEINRQPQIQALCWFADYLPVDDQWAAFSLSHPQGAMSEAVTEFDTLLQMD